MFRRPQSNLTSENLRKVEIKCINDSEEETQLTRGWNLISIMTGNARHAVWQRRVEEVY